MSNCRRCGAPIFFAMQIGKPGARPNPICASPRPEGNLRLIKGEGYEVLTKEALQAAKDANEPLYLSHFANCVHSKSFKRHVPGKEENEK